MQHVPSAACIEPRCDRAPAPEGLRCVLHASRLGQTRQRPAGLPSLPSAPRPPEPTPAVVDHGAQRALLAPPGAERLLRVGYAAIAIGWVGIGLVLADIATPGAMLAVGGHVAALGLAIASGVRRRHRSVP